MTEIKRLYRSHCDVKLAGVAGGVAEYFGMDPLGVRLLFVLLGLVSAGALLLVYLAAAVIVPANPNDNETCIHRFYRSSQERMIAGVCGGLAETWKMDPTLVRLMAVAAAFFSGGLAIPVYLVAWILMPLKEAPPVPRIESGEKTE
jgi:phage shock protein PspC (stress-responsive transcriptional regulator)